MDGRARLPATDLAGVRAMEAHYLSQSDPMKQSGWFGTAEKWERHRSIQLDAVERSGSFLDVGCANGYLLECLVRWGKTRGACSHRSSRDPRAKSGGERATRQVRPRLFTPTLEPRSRGPKGRKEHET